MIENYSVLMSVYKKEKPEFLKESINSILNQTRKTNDFCLVCDGPLTEALYKIVNDYTASYPDIFHVVYLDKNLGLGKALNIGIRECRNSVIARMDSDDIAFADRCERQLKFIQKGYDVISGTVIEFEDDITNQISQRKLPENDEQIKKFARKRNPFNHPCVMYKKEAVEAAGGYLHCLWFEDYYLWARMIMKGAKCYNLQSPILYMRAGDDMYQRRGGTAYLKAMINFKWKLRKMGFYSWIDFLYSVAGHFMVCIMPNSLRSRVYKRFLRK